MGQHVAEGSLVSTRKNTVAGRCLNSLLSVAVKLLLSVAQYKDEVSREP